MEVLVIRRTAALPFATDPGNELVVAALDFLALGGIALTSEFFHDDQKFVDGLVTPA